MVIEIGIKTAVLTISNPIKCEA